MGSHCRATGMGTVGCIESHARAASLPRRRWHLRWAQEFHTSAYCAHWDLWEWGKPGTWLGCIYSSLAPQIKKPSIPLSFPWSEDILGRYTEWPDAKGCREGQKSKNRSSYITIFGESEAGHPWHTLASQRHPVLRCPKKSWNPSTLTASYFLSCC